MHLTFKLLASSKHVPSQKIFSSEIDIQLGLPDGTTQTRSGIEYRHFISTESSQAKMAAHCIKNTLDKTSLTFEDIDTLVSVQGVAHQPLPCNAAAIAKELGLSKTAVFDINASCIGFMPALDVACSLLACGKSKRIVLIASDIASRGLNWSNAEESIIFGDGAACFILEAGNQFELVDSILEVHPDGFDYCQIPGGGSNLNPQRGSTDSDYLFHMDGKSVFKMASKVMPEMLNKFLTRNSMSIMDIDLFVPHQASNLGMSHIIKRLQLPEHKVVDIYRTHGNQVSASIPSALHVGLTTQELNAGKHILLLGTAAGFSAGAQLLKVL